MKDWLIVFDIDGTLLHFDIATHQPFIRPFVREFIEEFKGECEFALWTKGCEVYVNLVSGYFDVKWLFLWHSDDCLFNSKPLDVVKGKYPEFTECNTILVDDQMSNFSFNDGWKCILVPEYKGGSYDKTFYDLKAEVRNIINAKRTVVVWN